MKKAILLLISIFLLVGCSKKEVITAEQFCKLLEDRHFTVTDVSQSYDNKLVSHSYETNHEDYYIQFLDFKTTEQTISAFKSNEEDFENKGGNATTSKSKSTNNHSYYIKNADGYYYHLVRVENTVIYIISTSDYKDDTVQFVKDCGY